MVVSMSEHLTAAHVGSADGDSVGSSVGAEDGDTVDGASVGSAVAEVGVCVGSILGGADGALVGSGVGEQGSEHVNDLLWLFEPMKSEVHSTA